MKCKIEQAQYEYWFANVRPLSDLKKYRLRQEYTSAKDLFYIEEIQLYRYEYLKAQEILTIIQSRNQWNLEEQYQKMIECGISFITRMEPEYPQKLREIRIPPYALYWKGRLPEEDIPAIAIVGARRCSAYGEEMALEFGQELAKVGVQIISGLAQGVDGAASRGALNVGGISYGIMGCGVDRCYPREHIGLYMDIQERGGILSEQPIGEAPLPAYFPLRNRLISGLADVTLVMEAKEKSGSLITADQALEQGKDVYALPGPITSALSRGSNALIKQGAGILLSPKDLLEELHLICENKMHNMGHKQGSNKIVLESKENMLYSGLGLYPKNIDKLAKEVNLPIQEIMSTLISLEIKGYIREISKNYYIKIE
ncbi:MAG: DNA-processing protein DprA [Lachnospiraceae bacterium]